LENRIRNRELLKKVVAPEFAAAAVKSGMNIATSGDLQAGSPKLFFRALAERAKRGEVKELSLWSVCLFNYDIEGAIAEAGALKRRLGSHGDGTLRKAINTGKVFCNDMRTEILPQMVRQGLLGKLDVAVVYAAAITEEGHIIPSHSAVDIASYVEVADIVVVEIDHAIPLEIEGMHDIYLPALPPSKKEIPLYGPAERIGTPYIPAGVEKINYIIECQEPFQGTRFVPVDEKSQQLADHLIFFFKEEIKAGRLPKNLLPIECGIGAISDAILRSLARSDFQELEIYSGVIGDGIIDLIKTGKCKAATGGGVLLSNEGWQKFCKNIKKIKEKLILRPVEVTNNPEMVRRLGLIAVNGALEVDIYGNVNGSHIGGTQLVNGTGGSGVFASNAYLAVFVMPSTGKNGEISTIVPMVPHVDQPEHNVDVVVTDQGLADLRGLAPVERAEKLIHNCAHPDYRPLLLDYLERAKKMVSGHQPHILEEAFSFHQRLKKTGTMKTESK
jgi:succinyl-CoA:acetate CoA-transferase